MVPPIEQEVTSQWRQTNSPRLNVLSNSGLEIHQPIPELPTREMVMDELQEVTLRYLNVDDPIEREARQRRVLQSEIDGTVEETATRILQASLSNAVSAGALTSPLSRPTTAQATTQEPAVTNQTKKRGRPAKTNTTKPSASRNSIRLSPKTYAGMGSRKRNLTQIHASPGTSNRTVSRQGRLGRQPAPANSAAAPPIVLIPSTAKQQVDFHLPKPSLP